MKRKEAGREETLKMRLTVEIILALDLKLIIFITLILVIPVKYKRAKKTLSREVEILRLFYTTVKWVLNL